MSEGWGIKGSQMANLTMAWLGSILNDVEFTCLVIAKGADIKIGVQHLLRDRPSGRACFSQTPDTA